MLLALDVGNSNITIGVFDGSSLRNRWRLRTVHQQTQDEWGILFRNLFAMSSLDFAAIDGVIVASVVPPLDPTLAAMADRYFGQQPMFVTSAIDTGVRVLYDNPRDVGADERFVELVPDLMEGITPARLARAYLKALTPKLVPRVDLFHVAAIRFSVADAVVELLDELPRAGRISFRRLTAGLVERLEVIVRFLALLELFKQGFVELDQPESFGEIEVVWLGDVGEIPSADILIDDYEG